MPQRITPEALAELKRVTEGFTSTTDPAFDLGQLALSCWAVSHPLEVEHGPTTIHDVAAVRALVEEVERLSADVADLRAMLVDAPPIEVVGYDGEAECIACGSPTHKKPTHKPDCAYVALLERTKP